MARKELSLARDELALVERAASGLGVTLDTWGPLPGGRVVLAWICRNGGATSDDVDATMRVLCATCDRRGLRLELSALGGAPGLVAFYERYGFALDDPDWMPRRGDEAGPSMRRPLGAPLADAPLADAPIRDPGPAAGPSPGR
jgi:hypothetical protein